MAPEPPPNYSNVQVVTAKQPDGTYKVHDTLGWSCIATDKKFALAIETRRRQTLGQIKII